MKLVISDAHEGLKAAVTKVLPATWQSCRVDFMRNATAHARSHSGPGREAAMQSQSSVPWIGFLVADAVSGVLLTVFCYFALLLAR